MWCGFPFIKTEILQQVCDEKICYENLLNYDLNLVKVRLPTIRLCDEEVDVSMFWLFVKASASGFIPEVPVSKPSRSYRKVKVNETLTSVLPLVMDLRLCPGYPTAHRGCVEDILAGVGIHWLVPLRSSHLTSLCKIVKVKILSL